MLGRPWLRNIRSIIFPTCLLVNLCPLFCLFFIPCYCLNNDFWTSSIFPPILAQMSTVGEETGKMDEVLERVAIYYEGEVDHLVKGLSTALEPIILVMLGGMVGFLII